MNEKLLIFSPERKHVFGSAAGIKSSENKRQKSQIYFSFRAYIWHGCNIVDNTTVDNLRDPECNFKNNRRNLDSLVKYLSRKKITFNVTNDDKRCTKCKDRPGATAISPKRNCPRDITNWRRFIRKHVRAYQFLSALTAFI